jgi:hypothetical protein
LRRRYKCYIRIFIEPVNATRGDIPKPEVCTFDNHPLLSLLLQLTCFLESRLQSCTDTSHARLLEDRSFSCVVDRSRTPRPRSLEYRDSSVPTLVVLYHRRCLQPPSFELRPMARSFATVTSRLAFCQLFLRRTLFW